MHVIDLMYVLCSEAVRIKDVVIEHLTSEMSPYLETSLAIPNLLICGDTIMSGAKIPKEIIDQILDHLVDAQPDTRYSWPFVQLWKISETAKQELARARLINKAFCDCAAPLLFQNIRAFFPESSGVKLSAWARKILHFSANGLIGHVKRLEIGFQSSCDPEGCLVQGLLLESLYAIPTLVSACKNLHVLEIKGSPRDRDGCPALSALNRQIYNQSVDQLFRLLSHRKDGSGLKAIAISLPLAHHYGERLSKSLEYCSDIDQNPVAQVLKSIHRLEVTVSDPTGHRGMRYWPKDESVGHAEYPNDRHQGELWEFVGLAKQLRSLTIQCTHMLNFDRPSLDNITLLQELKLMRVSMSESHLIRLVDRNRPSLKAIEFDLVNLESGTWESSLLLLCTIPQLHHFYIDSCGYTSTGASSRHAIRWLPEPDNPVNIETHHYSDWDALGHVQRHVNAVRRAANVPLYTDYDYRHMSRPTLKEEYEVRTGTV